MDIIGMCHRPLDIPYRVSLVIFNFDVIFFVQGMSCPSLGDVGDNKDEKMMKGQQAMKKWQKYNGGRETMRWWWCTRIWRKDDREWENDKEWQ